MLVDLTKDWGTNKKGEQVDIKDQTVLDKGLETGLFVKPKKKVKKKTEK